MLELRGVARTYAGDRPVHALRSTDLIVDSGDYLSITGRSGSGKSTLLNVLGLLDGPSEGSYTVGSVETVGADAALVAAIRGQLFGFVFQAFHLLNGRTVLENIELGMLYSVKRSRVRRKAALELAVRVGLEHRLEADPRQLSGGEKQRVAIARAVAGSPSVLFCDEPTGNLDTENSANVMNLLQDLHGKGLTIVVVTHDPDVANRASRRLLVVDGVVVPA
jgi:putative ABC transport system ATP-binding protein